MSRQNQPKPSTSTQMYSQQYPTFSHPHPHHSSQTQTQTGHHLQQPQVLPMHQHTITTLGTSQLMPHHQRPPSQMIGTPFIEPSQYLTAIPAIPVQPVIVPTSSTFPVISSVQYPSEYVHSPGVELGSNPNQLHDHLQRKQEELQKFIVQQQEELRRVSEQLFMARYGILPSIVPINLGSGMSTSSGEPRCTTPMHHSYHEVPSHLTSQSNSSTIHHQHHIPIHQQSQQRSQNQPFMSHIMDPPSDHSNQQIEANQSGDEMISYMQLSSNNNNSSNQLIQHVPQSTQSQSQPNPPAQPAQRQQPQSSNQDLPQQQQMVSSSEIELMPFQMTEEQAQILLFTSNSKNE